MGAALNFLIRYKEDGNDEKIITNNKSWIHFYKPERKSEGIVKKKRKKHREKNE